MIKGMEPLRPLTSLRFFAALAVVLLHLSGLGPANPPWMPQGQHAAAAVALFFMLSGLVLTYNYREQFRTLAARPLWNFYAARWARIWPVHALTLTLIALVPGYRPWLRAACGEHFRAGAKPAAANLALVHAFLPTRGWVVPFNTVSWSLSCEWFFYLCLPLLLWGLTGPPRRRALTLALALTPWLAALLSLLSSDNPWWRERHYFFPLTRLVDFVAGVLLGLAISRPGAASAPNRARGTLVEAGAVAAVAAWAWLGVRFAPAHGTACAWTGYYVPVFALLLWAFARGEGALSRALSAGPLVWLGEISFSIYMFHWVVLTAVGLHAQALGVAGWRWGWRWLLVAGITLALSAACYHCYELPLRSWLRRRLTWQERPVRPDAASRRAAA